MLIWQARFEQTALGIALLQMNPKRLAWFALLLVSCVAVFLCRSWSPNSARSARIIVGVDLTDAGLSPTRAKSGYDFYFDRINHSTDVVLSRTFNHCDQNPPLRVRFRPLVRHRMRLRS
jgi:hypothetical protein